MKHSTAVTLLLIGFASVVVLASCGGGNGSDSVGNVPNPPVISTIPPPAGTVSIAYSFTFTVASGGTVPFTWSETGALPPGLTFSNGGMLSGTPTTAGSFPITVMVQDSHGLNAAPQNSIIQISAQLLAFTPTGIMGSTRSGHTATLLKDGKVLVTGGFDSNGQSLAIAELFDTTSGTFTPTGSMKTARSGHTATVLNDGTVLVAGGVDNSNGKFLATAELFDPTSGTFTLTGSMGTARESHTGTLLRNGEVLVTGGGDAGNVFATAELFDPTSGSFSPTGSMGSARLLHTATLLNDGKVLVTGGGDNNSILATAELFDTTSGTFTPTGSMGTGRESHTAVLLNDGKVLVTAGEDNNTNFVATAELFDPASESFSSTGSMGTARAAHTATLLKDGRVLVNGGATFVTRGGLRHLSATATAELFDPASGSFSPTGSMGTARKYHTATLLNDGKVLVVGGQDAGTAPLATAELFQ
jgi:WD40 repeat protein